MGAIRKTEPTFSYAVIENGFDVPVAMPFGILIVQRKFRVDASQLHTADATIVAEVPGPVSVTFTLPAAASAAAVAAGMGCPLASKRRNFTGIDEPDFARVVFGSGDRKPPNP